MPSRMKEEERMEKMIRGLMKHPENRRCINCNSSGPQYVCTTFWTFVCTNCSGVHREFTHRVKSVSMANFSIEEVSSLQSGGNERAREIYFKTWDPQLNSLPNGSNLTKLRNFIKHVYVERRFTGERSSDKLAMLKMELKDGFYEKRSRDSCPTSTRSTPTRDESYEKCSFSGRHDPRSPRIKEIGSHTAPRSRSCAPFEIVDDRIHDDDDDGSIKRYESHRFASRGESLSPDLRRGREIVPRKVRSVKEVRGDRDPSHSTEGTEKLPDNDTCDEKATETSSPASTGGKHVEQKIERSSSMIDTKTNAEPETSDANTQVKGSSSSLPETQQTAPATASSKPRSVNSVEALLFELAATVAMPGGSTSEAPNSVEVSSVTPAAVLNGSSEAAPNQGNVLALPSTNGDSSVEVDDGKHLVEAQQHQPSKSSTVDGSSTDQQSSLSNEASSNQDSCPSPAPNLQAQSLSNQLSWPSPPSTSQAQTVPNQQSWPSPEPNTQTASNSQAPTSLNFLAQQLSQVAPRLPLENSSADASMPAARKELPAEIFTLPYSFFPAPVPYVQFHPAQQMGIGMRVGMKYNPSTMPPPNLSGRPKSKNPFDVDDDAPQAQSPMFPYMAPLAHMGFQPQPSPYAFALALHPQQLPSYGMAMPPGAHMGQQLPNSMQVSREVENNNSNNTEAAFASLDPLHSVSIFQAPTKTGNPFG